MYAITLNGFGDPEVMQWTQVADLPAPGPGEVTIDVVAAGGEPGRRDAAPGSLSTATRRQ